MKVTKLFEITFDEPGLDFLSADNLKLILDAALTEEDATDMALQVRDLTNRVQYMEKFKVVVFDDIEEQEDVPEIDVQKKNEGIKKRLKKEKPPAPPHNAPGKGALCKSPELFKEKLSTGGSISFCPACGFQYADTDLLESVK